MSDILRLSLHDVQGLFGGRDIFIVKRGLCVLRIVKPTEDGLHEVRSSFVIMPKEMASLQKVVRTSDLLSYREKERFGVPDEARPRIELEFEGGEIFIAEKWDGDADQRFDALYRELIKLEAKKGTQLYSGPYEPNWRYTP